AEAEILLQSADRIGKTGARFAAQLADPLFEVAGALRNADHGACAETRNVAQEVGADSRSLQPALDRAHVADAGRQLATKIVDRALALARRDSAESRADAGGCDTASAAFGAGRAAGAGRERRDSVLDRVHDVVEIATVSFSRSGRKH